MSRRNEKRSESQILRERATNCRRLAVGVGDAAFAEMLNGLAEECEAKAALSDGDVVRDESVHSAECR